MIYEWKCKLCGEVVEVQRNISEYNRPPKPVIEVPASPCDHEWVKVYTSSTPFQHLRESGEFADEHGNFAPRKLD